MLTEVTEWRATAWQSDSMETSPPLSPVVCRQSRVTVRLLTVLILSLAPFGAVFATDTRCAVLEVFVKGDSERSAQARAHIDKTYGGRQGVKIVYRDVEVKETDLARYWKLAEYAKVEKPGMPAYYVSGRFDYGWDEKTTPARLAEALTIEVFIRSDCPRCAQAKPYLQNEVAKQYPGYQLVFQDILSVAAARTRMDEIAQRYHVAAGVPGFHACGRFLVGWNDRASTGKQWEDLLKSVTVPCTPATPAPPAPGSGNPTEKTSQRVQPVGRDPWSRDEFYQPSLWSVAWADEPLPPAADDAPAAPAPDAVPAPSLDAPPPSLDDDAQTDVPPPKPVHRAIPEETAPGEELLPPPMPVQSDVVHLPMVGDVNWKQIGLPAFTITIGLVDGFNPCAMWVLMFLLSVLVNLRDRWKILAVAGTFVFISGAAYLAFMAVWFNAIKLMGLVRPAQVILGLLGLTVGVVHIKDFFAFKKGVSFSIPESAKKGIYQRVRQIVMAESLVGALLGASILATLVNLVEMMCTMGLPALYTGILSMQHLPTWEYYAYLLLYIVAYMFDDSIMVAVAVITLGKHKLQEKGGRMLKLVSGAVIAGIGVVMLVAPKWLV